MTAKTIKKLETRQKKIRNVLMRTVTAVHKKNEMEALLHLQELICRMMQEGYSISENLCVQISDEVISHILSLRHLPAKKLADETLEIVTDCMSQHGFRTCCPEKDEKGVFCYDKNTQCPFCLF